MEIKKKPSLNTALFLMLCDIWGMKRVQKDGLHGLLWVFKHVDGAVYGAPGLCNPVNKNIVEDVDYLLTTKTTKTTTTTTTTTINHCCLQKKNYSRKI